MMTTRCHEEITVRPGRMRLLTAGKIDIDRVRSVLGVLSIFAGIVHLVLAGPHFEEARWLGSAFLLDGVALIGAGLWLLVTDTRRAMMAAGVGAALTAVAYVASRTTGLPGMDREAWDVLGLVTTVAEVAIVMTWPFLNRFAREAAVRSGYEDERRGA